RDDIGRPADGDVIAEDRGETLDAVDAVLQRNHAGVGTYERARLLAGRLRIPQLDGEQHQLDGSDPLRVVGDVEILEMKVAKRASFAQASRGKGSPQAARAQEGPPGSGPRPPPRRNTPRRRPPP